MKKMITQTFVNSRWARTAVVALFAASVCGCGGLKPDEKRYVGKMKPGIKMVQDAIDEYKAKFKTYPSKLEQLVKPPEGKGFIKSNIIKPVGGIKWDYTYFIGDYELRLSPPKNKGIFLFTDSSRVVRYRKDMPANANDPVAP